MKTLLLSLAATAALAAAAAPAAAQDWRGYDHQRGYGGYDQWRGYDHGDSITGRVDGLEWKISNAAQEGRISYGQARRLMSELRQVQPLAWRVQTGQASGWERQRLDQAVNHIESAVNGYGRYDRYGRDDGWRGRY